MAIVKPEKESRPQRIEKEWLSGCGSMPGWTKQVSCQLPDDDLLIPGYYNAPLQQPILVLSAALNRICSMLASFTCWDMSKSMLS